MHSITENESQPVYIGGRKVAVLRNGGNLCDIRRHSSGFLYSGGYKVAVSEALLESLSDNVLLQFTNMDTKDTYTITVHDFRHYSMPIRYGKFEMQRACEIVRMNHTIEGKPKRGKKRVNELLHIDQTPTPEYSQPTLFERITR